MAHLCARKHTDAHVQSAGGRACACLSCCFWGLALDFRLYNCTTTKEKSLSPLFLIEHSLFADTHSRSLFLFWIDGIGDGKGRSWGWGLRKRMGDNRGRAEGAPYITYLPRKYQGEADPCEGVVYEGGVSMDVCFSLSPPLRARQRPVERRSC
jgi:hypothetical protein